MKIRFSEMLPDGTMSPEEIIDLGEDHELDRILEEARAGWEALKAAGTPYWCIHEGRTVSHKKAIWIGDDPSNPIHKKHGVRCLECLGYIQEG